MRDKLQAAREGQAVVGIVRGAFEETAELGHVLAVGSDLLLLARISSEIRLDGFVILRIADISELEAPHAHAEFVSQALRLKGEDVATAPEVSLADMAAAIRSAGQLYPLLALHCEAVDLESCQVGKVIRVNDDTVELLEIDPDADWDDEPTQYPLSEITRVDFGGGYEEALALVGSDAP